MADTALSGLTALAGTALAADDLLYVVDSSETGIAKSKGIRGDNIAAAISTIAPVVRTSGVTPYFRITAPADTTLTASTEAVGVSFVGATRQHATGALTTQREFVIEPPTYSFVGASTITEAATIAVTGPPIAGTNATLTRTYCAIWSGISAFRQVGGTAGVDEVQVYDDGSCSYFESKSGAAKVVSDTTSVWVRAVGDIYITTSGSQVGKIQTTELGLGSATQLAWNSATTFSSGALDTGMERVAPGVVGATNGGSGFGFVMSPAGNKVVASNQTNITDVLSSLTDLTVPVAAGRTYRIEGQFLVNESVAGDGFALGIGGGSATATDVRTQFVGIDSAAVVTTGQVSSLAWAILIMTYTGAGIVMVKGTITVNAGGTIIPQFSQRLHTTGTATVYRGSTFCLTDITP